VLQVLCAFALVAAVGSSAPADGTKKDETRYRIQKDISYLEEGSKASPYQLERSRLDLYYPENKTDFATVVWFHGGGLTGGSRHIPAGLKDQGIAVVAANYRLHPKVTCPAYLQDAAAAVAWTFRNIEKHGGDPAKIFVSGHSAGGYLTSMIGIDKRWLAEYDIDADRIAGLIPLSGHTITHMTVRKERGIPKTQPLVDAFAPLYHVRPDAPPILLITGDREMEMLGRYEENAYFMRMLRVVGHKDVTLHELQGHGHGMVAPAMSPMLRWLRARASCAGAKAMDGVTDGQLYAKVEEAWRATWDRFYDERTHLFYDRVCSYDAAKRLAYLPTPKEIHRQYPNRNGWGTGMEDCAISAGVILSMICDRFAVTGDRGLRAAAEKVFAGMVLLGTLSPSKGFVIRGVCPADGRSHYCESSRDQYTWYVYGLWRYYHSPLSTAAEKAKMREIISAICARMDRNVVAKHDYHIGREDGTFDGLVDKMWNNEAHEIARLPMIYAIGADLTGASRWRDAARRLSPEAAAQSAEKSTTILYAMLQQQVSLEALYELEESSQLKAKWLACMRLTAGRAEAGCLYGRGYRVQDLGKLNMDWRTWPIRESRGYRIPTLPEVCKREDRTIRQPAEAALVQLLLPRPRLTSKQLAAIRRAIAQVDYSKIITYGLYYTQAVYWRGVRLGVFELPRDRR